MPTQPAPAGSGRAGAWLVAGAAIGWGTWSLFLRTAALPATLTGPIIFLVMGLAAWPLAWREPAPRWDRAALGALAVAGVADALNVVAFFGAIERTTIAIAVLTHYLAPILIALAAPYVDGQRTPGARPAAAVALAGLLIVLAPWRAPAAHAVVGAALGAASAVCYAANVFALRRLSAQVGAARAMSTHAFVGAVVIAPLAVGQLDALTLPRLGVIAAGAVVIGAGCGVAFTAGLLRIGSARAAVLTFLEPVVAVIVGATVWGEPLGAQAVLGGALVLGAGLQVARQAR